MKAIHRILLLVVTVVQLTSCGLLDFDVDEFGAETATEMRIGQDTIYVMVGDTFSLNPVFTPDTVNITDLYILPVEQDVVAVRGSDKLEAIGEGGTKLYIVSVSARIQDSCMVYVGARWDIANKVWPYETVFYAHVTVDGQPPTEDMEVSAFVGNECRGIGQLKSAHGISYWQFRVGSDILYDNALHIDDGLGEDDDEEEDNDSDEQYTNIYFRCYDRTHRKLYTTATHGTFDGETHGTLSELFEIAF